MNGLHLGFHKTFFAQKLDYVQRKSVDFAEMCSILVFWVSAWQALELWLMGYIFKIMLIFFETRKLSTMIDIKRHVITTTITTSGIPKIMLVV